MLKKVFFAFVFLGIVLLCTIKWNRYQVYPSNAEIDVLKQFYGNSFILKDKQSVVNAVNFTIDTIKHAYLNNKSAIDIIKVINQKKGLCYDRSLLLQKLLLVNGFRVRPVFVFWGWNTTAFYNFINAKDSHNIFEVYLEGQWFVIEDIQKVRKSNLISIDEYITSGLFVPKHSRYIRHLNNRNGRFLRPSWVPDIY